MILPYQEIVSWAQGGGVEPFVIEHANPASLDLRIQPMIVDLTLPDSEIEVESIELWPGRAVLATTVERVCLPADVAGAVYLKSSWARRGLDHALAGWIDPGFTGELTLELHAHRPLIIMPGDRVVQLVLYQLGQATTRPYQGRYQNQSGPTRAR